MPLHFFFTSSDLSRHARNDIELRRSSDLSRHARNDKKEFGKQISEEVSRKSLIAIL
ncbi:hypothetical protein RND71_021207 [Anisodus tanguticus]|uniref:Uncharacterized protein n=1 Tax=Anisodus tanguticus TaxID=243964 RepID=A0AAE1RW47_9SOLA|nr:hypothetical protein RND71_021207 [Anisodus tanguticus]